MQLVVVINSLLLQSYDFDTDMGFVDARAASKQSTWFCLT